VAADSGLVSAVCLLDLTAAFDTVDHDLFLLCLERQFGLRSVTLLWFRSYLCCRSYRVWFAGAASRTVFVACLIVRGQYLDRGCSSCTLQIWPTRRKSMMSISMAMPTTLSCTLSTGRNCRKLSQTGTLYSTDMEYWMSANRLRLNMDKTELLCAGTRYHVSTLNDSSPSLQLNNVTVDACAGSSSVVRSESGQTRFQCQCDVLSSSPSTQTYPALACLRHVARRLLQHSPRRGSQDNHRQATTSVECCVSDTRKFDHGLSRLMHQELHWLDISERVNYKLGMLTHRCLLGKAPVYTCPTVVSRSLKWQHVGIYGLLHVIS